MSKQEFTITIFTEDKMGILSRIISLITRRHINIESINASPSSIEHIYRFVILINEEVDVVRKLVAQIDKQVYVLKAFYYTDDQLIHQEMAMYKIPVGDAIYGKKLEKILRLHNAKIVAVEKEFLVIEKTGYQSETEDLLEALKETGVYEFVRSGRVAIVRPLERLNNYLKSIELNFKN